MNITEMYEQNQTLDKEEAKVFLSKLTNCNVMSTVSQEEDEEAWLKNRTKGIGGSDVGAICGVNKWSSARMIYFDKTGQFKDGEGIKFSEEAKERMYWGHKLEPIIADEFTKRTGKKTIIAPATLTHKDHPWAIANVDRFIVDDNNNPIGVLEIKTADARLNSEWEEGDFTLSYTYQLQWYLWVTGLEYGAFAALVGGNKFHIIEVFRNDELLEEEIVPKCDTFWNYNVMELVEPELTGSDADTEDLKNRYDEVVKNSEISLVEDELMNELASFIVESKQQIKELENRVKAASNKIKEKLKDKEIGYTADHIVKWSPRKTRRVDTTKLKSEFPEVYEAVLKETSYRVFTVK